MKAIISAVMIAALVPLCANAALSQSDTSYLTSAMQTQLGRYALASLAQKNASSSAVKSFAKSLATDASAQTRTLDAIAKTNGVPPAKHPGVRDSYHYSQLSGLHGKAFDKQFVQEVKVDDQIVASTDQSASTSLSDPQLRDYAKRRYAALQQELKKLDKLGS